MLALAMHWLQWLYFPKWPRGIFSSRRGRIEGLADPPDRVEGSPEDLSDRVERLENALRECCALCARKNDAYETAIRTLAASVDEIRRYLGAAEARANVQRASIIETTCKLGYTFDEATGKFIDKPKLAN
jgi:hypothetical protein